MNKFAYLDPGTGSLFIQMVFGAILAGLVVFRNFIRNVAAKLRLTFSRQSSPDQE